MLCNAKCYYLDNYIRNVKGYATTHLCPLFTFHSYVLLIMHTVNLVGYSGSSTTAVFQKKAALYIPGMLVYLDFEAI